MIQKRPFFKCGGSIHRSISPPMFFNIYMMRNDDSVGLPAIKSIMAGIQLYKCAVFIQIGIRYTFKQG